MISEYFPEKTVRIYSKDKRGSPRGLWGTREQGNFYNGNMGTKQKNHGEQGNIKYIGEQGNKAPLLVCTHSSSLVFTIKNTKYYDPTYCR